MATLHQNIYNEIKERSYKNGKNNRILFIKDGKIFNELVKGNDTRKQFFEKIIEVQTLLGGDLNDVI